MKSELLTLTDRGLYCSKGDFYIDPWKPVARAVITHAHSDHARPGHQLYIASPGTIPFLKARLGDTIRTEAVRFGENRNINGVNISLVPAGHVLGSAQIRVEHRGEYWGVTGDYKTQIDPTVENFEPVRCHTLITECTFGLPVYRWPDPAEVFREINEWWRENQEKGISSLLYGYSLGKAQRLLYHLDPSIGPICLHGAVHRMTGIYRDSGIQFPETTRYRGNDTPAPALMIAPASFDARNWIRSNARIRVGFASGWMAIRGMRRRRGFDRGFVLSDHVDWDALNRVVEASGATKVLSTHGYAETFSRWLRHKGLDASPLNRPNVTETRLMDSGGAP